MSTNNTKETSSIVLSVRVPESLKEQLDYVFISHEAMLAWEDARHAQKNPALPKPDVRLRKKSV